MTIDSNMSESDGQSLFIYSFFFMKMKR